MHSRWPGDIPALVSTPKQDDAHEAMCRRCGMSCHFAIPVNGLPVVFNDLHCRFLETDDDGKFRCGVYEQQRTLGCR